MEFKDGSLYEKRSILQAVFGQLEEDSIGASSKVECIMTEIAEKSSKVTSATAMPQMDHFRNHVQDLIEKGLSKKYFILALVLNQLLML